MTIRRSHGYVGRQFRGVPEGIGAGRRGWMTGALIALGCISSACDSGVAADDPSEPLSLAKGAISGGGSSNGGLAPLSSVAVPQLGGGDIVDAAAAVRLGKALFWDMQTGGDGQVACASCHFHGGADSRLLNVLNPGPDGIFASGGVTSAGQLFSPSAITNDDRVGSQGVVGSLFVAVDPDPAVAADICTPDLSAPFFSERRVTGRNAPPVVGAVFNRDNFWDGRANHASMAPTRSAIPPTEGVAYRLPMAAWLRRRSVRPTTGQRCLARAAASTVPAAWLRSCSRGNRSHTSW